MQLKVVRYSKTKVEYFFSDARLYYNPLGSNKFVHFFRNDTILHYWNTHFGFNIHGADVI